MRIINISKSALEIAKHIQDEIGMDLKSECIIVPEPMLCHAFIADGVESVYIYCKGDEMDPINCQLENAQRKINSMANQKLALEKQLAEQASLIQEMMIARGD